ncbi:MAG: exosortase family protein XrtG [Lachnospiraceae bacterium]|nr:exosortase family protein XrtG [Lachnospiraceae bacterium]
MVLGIKIAVVLLWIALLVILKRAKLQGWYTITGVIGMFIISVVVLMPVLVEPLSQFVAAIAGLVGRLTGTFESYFKYGIIFIKTVSEDYITLRIDFECSGIIEILLYIAWVFFFSVFSNYQKIVMSVVGFLYIVFINAVRIIIICEVIHFGGNEVYGIAHNIVGKLFFYLFIVLFYFYVFTRQHVISMKLGGFGYTSKKTDSKE